MKNAVAWKRLLDAEPAILARLYPDPAAARERYFRLIDRFAAEFGAEREFALFSVPGRTEIGGNHTDHQRGRVLAAAVEPDMIAAAAPNGRPEIDLRSEGFSIPPVDLRTADPSAPERGSSAALIRGVAARLGALGFPIGGFDACMSSEVAAGSGLSSSAAFEVLIGEILSGLFCAGDIPPIVLAQAGQHAENHYFGKPCGLMDQTACAVGGFALMDFSSPEAPAVRRISCDPAAFGYSLCIVDAGGSHQDLTEEYAAIPEEMRAVAGLFGAAVLGEVSSDAFYAALPSLRGRISDRALLRAMHFFDENDRVLLQTRALETGNFPAFLNLVRASGDSSFTLLQNIYPVSSSQERSVALALAWCRRILRGSDGACRVHGGGFAGTIQAFVPLDRLPSFCRETDALFGPGRCRALSVRQTGAVMLSST